MDFGQALAQTALLAKPEPLKHFEENFPEAWIEQALSCRTGTATLRRRRLPAEQVIWLVIGMALFRDRPILEVVDKLDLALPDSRGDTCIAPSAIPQARARLGEEPLQWLFARSAQEWAHQSARRHSWRGLSIYGIDGSTVRLPDTEEIRSHFGDQACGDNADVSSYPLARIVVLMAVRSHLLAAASLGAYHTGEISYAKELWEQIPDDSLTLEDRGFFDAGSLVPLAAKGKNRHWLIRAKSNTRWKVIETFASGDELVEMEVSPQARQKDPTLPSKWRARAIRYQRKGFQPQVLLTSMLDPAAYPAAEIISLYHERWELELGYDEIKTELLDREEAIRSKTVAGVKQELWGLLIAFNLVRLEMERIADEAGVEPIRISFVNALRYIQDEMLWCAIASPGSIPKKLQRLRHKLKRFILPPRRSERSYPRVVKLKTAPFPRKKTKRSLN